MLTDVALYFYGDDLALARVSKKLGITSSSLQCKGKKKVISTTHEYTVKFAALTSDLKSNILSDHLDQLASQIGTAGIALDDIEGVEGAYIDVCITANADEDGEGTCEFVLKKINVASLAKLGLPVSFTVDFEKEISTFEAISPDDKYGDGFYVNPDTGDVKDSDGNIIGNLGDDEEDSRIKTGDYLIDVELILRGDDLDPELVSKKLGIIPSKAHRKGEKRLTCTKHEYITQIGIWKLKADSDSSILSDHLDQLSPKIETIGIPFRDIKGIEEAYVDVFIAGDADEDRGGTCEFGLSKSNLSSIARLGLPVGFTVTVCRP